VIGIVITHSHSDHIQDTPYIAKKLGVPVWGNESVDTCLKIHGLPGCKQILAGGETFKVGPFTVEAVKTRHGLVALGKVPLPGRIDPSLKPPLRLWHFRHGDPPLLMFVTAGGKTIFHQGTANLIDNLLPIREVESAWVCASGYQKTPDFLRRLLARVTPKTFIPFHFDDFSLPLSENTRYIPGSDPFIFGEKVKQVAPEVQIRVPRPFEPIPF
jgi:L-ascorbate metabolism protein UlaG (beta-lactamase superfamily)